MTAPPVDRPLVRFAGLLHDTLEFEQAVGWETLRAAHEPPPCRDYALDLVDAQHQLLVTSHPAVTPPDCLAVGERVPADVVGYLPLHPGGRTIVFRRGEQTIAEVEVAPSPPELRIDHVALDAPELLVRWSATHDRPLTYNVAFFVGRSRAFTLALGLDAGEARFDLSRLPGGDECHVAVLATDGLRSAAVVSDPFAYSGAPARAHIATPRDREPHPYGQPLTLIGQVLDAGGDPMAEEVLVWRLDGDVVARGRRVVALPPPAPGLHEITLDHVGGALEARDDEVTIEVEPASEAQREWERAATRLGERPGAGRQTGINGDGPTSGPHSPATA